MPQFPYEKVSLDLLSHFDGRTKDIVMKRFGLEEEEPFTLERVGQDYGITRERVRQIVESSLEDLKERITRQETKPIVRKIFDHFRQAIQKFGNAKREDLLLDALRGESKKPFVFFILNLGDQFLRHKETDEFYPFWTVEKDALGRVPKLLRALHEYFERKKDAVHLEELQAVHDVASDLSLSALLEISKRIVRAHDGRWGLWDWPFVNPRTVRDKTHIALQYAQKPLHFREVAKVIEELQGRFPLKKDKPVLAQTVHNELIKDSRFVLVGRGLYALTSWGYAPGTVKEVIVGVLQKAKKPLGKEELMEQVGDQRQVKESTILLNLQDKKLFARDEEGRYYVR